LQLQMWRGLIEIKRGLEEKKEGGGVNSRIRMRYWRGIQR